MLHHRHNLDRNRYIIALIRVDIPHLHNSGVQMSYSYYGTRLTYQEHLMTHEFLDSVTSSPRDASERV